MSNILTFRIIIIIITIISLSFSFTITRNSQEQTLAQTSASTGSFVTYENSNYRFKIQYPSNWEKVEFSPGIKESGRNIIVNFISPQETFSDLFREYLIIEVQRSSVQCQIIGSICKPTDRYLQEIVAKICCNRI